MHIALFFEETW